MDDGAAGYEAHAAAFLQRREASVIGASTVARWARTLPRGASVLELGCGGGEPVSRALLDAGLALHAVDASPSLVAVFRARFPSVPVQCAPVRRSDFFARRFDAIVAVGLVFLLSERDQRALIAKAAAHLAPRGRLLFTAPTRRARWRDAVTGARCRSLGLAGYAAAARTFGGRVVATFVDEGSNDWIDVERGGGGVEAPSEHLAREVRQP